MYQINILYNFSLYMLYVDSLSIFIINWAFPGGLVVRILGFHCHGLDLIPARPWVEILQVVQHLKHILDFPYQQFSQKGYSFRHPQGFGVALAYSTKPALLHGTC